MRQIEEAFILLIPVQQYIWLSSGAITRVHDEIIIMLGYKQK